MKSDYLMYLLGALIWITEVGLILALRSATKEMRGIRTEFPRMIAAFGGFSLLFQAYNTAKGLRKNAAHASDE